MWYLDFLIPFCYILEIVCLLLRLLLDPVQLLGKEAACFIFCPLVNKNQKDFFFSLKLVIWGSRIRFY